MRTVRIEWNCWYMHARAHIRMRKKEGLGNFYLIDIWSLHYFLVRFLMLFKQVIRASPTGELNEEANLKSYTFSFCLCFYSLQWLRQTNSYFSSLSFEEPFLHFPVEMAKENDCWPTAIFIVICQQFIFFFL